MKEWDVERSPEMLYHNVLCWKCCILVHFCGSAERSWKAHRSGHMGGESYNTTSGGMAELALPRIYQWAVLLWVTYCADFLVVLYYKFVLSWLCVLSIWLCRLDHICNLYHRHLSCSTVDTVQQFILYWHVWVLMVFTVEPSHW